ncbi:hypothetical protein D3C84_821360 [compost metagenome]
MLDVEIDHALGEADDDRGHGTEEHLVEWQAIAHWPQAHAVLDDAVGTKVGNEGLAADLQRLAAGAGQAHHMPVVDQVIVRAADQERAQVGHPPLLVEHPRAQERTALAMIRAA